MSSCIAQLTDSCKTWGPGGGSRQLSNCGSLRPESAPTAGQLRGSHVSRCLHDSYMRMQATQSSSPQVALKEDLHI
eukprot:1157487-Pelagomonas_calceolata.AAC.1